MVRTSEPRWQPRTALARYLLAFGIFALALLLRFLILPVDGRLAFVTFYPASALAFFLCGVGPGLLFVGLSTFSGFYIFTPPVWSWGVSVAGVLAVLSYMLSCLLIGWIVARQQATSERLVGVLGQLEQSEGRLDAIVNAQSDIVCRFDRQGQLVFANAACRKLFALDDETLGQASWRSIVAPEDLPLVLQRLAALAPGRPTVTTENRIHLDTGEWRWAEFTNYGIFDAAGQLLEVQSVGRDITERKGLETRLNEVMLFQQDLYDKAPCGYYSLDRDGIFRQINETALSWIGCTRDEAVGKLGPVDFFLPEGVALFRANFRRFVEEGRMGPLEFDLKGRQGELRRVSVMATAVTDDTGQFVRSRSVMFDISELYRVRTEMHRLNREQEAMLDNELVGIAKVRDRRTLWANEALFRMLGYTSAELVGQSTRLWYQDEATYRQLGEAAYPMLRQGRHYRTQLQMTRKGGQTIWVDISGTLLSEETGESMWMLLDITDLKQNQLHLESLASHDGLTGLPNRMLLQDRLQQGISQCQRLGCRLAVCFLDLDGFKTVNDEHGHGAGDHLLRVIASRLQTCVRGHDTVARLGGDEFVLLLSNLRDRAECETILQRVLDLVAVPVPAAGDVDLRVTGSIGVALFPEDGATPELLMARADGAMYQAKHEGKGRVSFG